MDRKKVKIKKPCFFFNFTNLKIFYNQERQNLWVVARLVSSSWELSTRIVNNKTSIIQFWNHTD